MMIREVENMPPKGSGNKALKQLTIEAREESVKDTNTYISQRVASASYEKNKVEQITVRLPKGFRQILSDYYKKNNKYNSVNDMIKSLIDLELSQSLIELPEGSYKTLQDYVDNSGKYKSVNDMIKSLLEAEIGQPLD